MSEDYEKRITTIKLEMEVEVWDLEDGEGEELVRMLNEDYDNYNPPWTGVEREIRTMMKYKMNTIIDRTNRNHIPTKEWNTDSKLRQRLSEKIEKEQAERLYHWIVSFQNKAKYVGRLSE